jgi:hypothetical protein
VIGEEPSVQKVITALQECNHLSSKLKLSQKWESFWFLARIVYNKIMKTFTNPKDLNNPIGEFVYEGCRYSGIPAGLTFSILSDGLATYLTETFDWLVEATTVAPVADNEYCCSKCNKDCGSKYMKERHEKVCKAEPQGLATILKPIFIFWNYKGLDRTQLSPDLLLPDNLGQPIPQQPVMTEKEVSEPMPGRPGMEMIGKSMQQVTTDRDGIAWYGAGVEDDIV